MDKAILTCAINGVLTDPKQHRVPVTPSELARSARDAYNAGASIIHIHFRDQGAGRGHLPSWDPEVAAAIDVAIREACPGIIINQTTGIVGPDVSGPIACLRRIKPELAAANAGTLNYLKLKQDGNWAWPPMVFDNPVAKVGEMLKAMHEVGAEPEFECFDVGIARSVDLYVRNGMTQRPHYNFVMGVASGMPVDAELLRWLLRVKPADAPWQTTLIGREEIWPLHQLAAELGGMLRTGLEDTFYMPDGSRADGNGELLQELARCAERAGRAVASPAEARAMLGLRAN
ncbi:MAG: 3-keto-5-aminohexanoate cleavage protein [Polyangiales bacterium]